MQYFEFTWFSNGDASSGTPYIASYYAKDEDDARQQFHAAHPHATIWSID